MITKKQKPNALDVLDALTHQVALEEAENGTATASDRAWSKDLGIKIEARLAELRRNLTPADPPKERARPLRPSTLAMARDALLAAIARLVKSMDGQVQYAHRNLKKLSVDDLRQLYDTLDPENRTNRTPE
jgi:hypothetical protein